MSRLRVTCPNCQGTGEQVDWADDQFGNTIAFYVPCDLCEGDGEMTYQVPKEVEV